MSTLGFFAFSQAYDDQLKRIQEALGELSDNSPQILLKAINTAARKARKEIVETAQERYVNHKGSVTLKSLKMSSAKGRNPTVRLSASGPMQEIMDFVVSPTTIAITNQRPSAYGVQVRSDHGLTLLNDKPRPFVVKFQNHESSHIALVQRAKSKKDPEKTVLSKVLTLALPHMYNTHETERILLETLTERIPEEVTKQIDKILKKAAK